MELATTDGIAEMEYGVTRSASDRKRDDADTCRQGEHGALDVRARSGIHRALSFLSQKYVVGTGWSDFTTRSSGAATSWITAHVLISTGLALPEPLRERAVSQLLEDAGSKHLWGFSPLTPPDADSTIHALHALQPYGCPVPRSTLNFLAEHRRSSGGFATYADETHLIAYRRGTDYSGWSSAHVCVTAAAVRLADAFPDVLPRKWVDSAWQFLINSQQATGAWRAYWWVGEYWATAMLAGVRNEHHESLHRGRIWLESQQAEAGCWVNTSFGNAPSPVLTAMALRALSCSSGASHTAGKAVQWLLEQQLADGSWSSVPTLRIPPPEVAKPDEYQSWRINGRGVGSICRDDRRVYTTAAVAGALKAWGEGFL